MLKFYISNVFLIAIIFVFFIFSLNYSLASLVFPGFNPYDIMRVLELCLLLITVAYLLAVENQFNALITALSCFPSAALFSLAFILICGLVSSFFAPLTKMALIEVAEYCALFFFTLTIAVQRIIWRKYVDNILIAIILFSAIYYSAYFIYFYLHNWLPLQNKGIFRFPGFVQIRFFAEYQIWTLPIIVIPLCYRMRSKIFYQLALFLFLIFWWSLAALNASKGLWVACIIATIVIYLLFKKKSLPFLIMQSICILLPIPLSFILFQIVPNLVHAPNLNTPTTSTHSIFHNDIGSPTQSWSDRIHMWQYAVNLIKQHPIIGAGPQHYAYYPNDLGAHPHNAILLIASEWGLAVTMVLIVLLGWGIKCWIKWANSQVKTVDKKTATSLIALTFTLIAAGIYSLCGGLVVTPLSQIMLCIILGWVLGQRPTPNKLVY